MCMERSCCFFKNCGIPCFIVCMILLIVIFLICYSTASCKKEKFNPILTASKLYDKKNLTGKKYLCINENVNVIPDECFKGLEELKRIDFKGDISYLGKNAFSGCKNLEEINFYGKLDYYDSDVFKKLENIKRVDFQDVKIIKQNSFAELPCLEYVTIKQGLELIEDGAFKNCKKMKLLKIPIPLPTMENDCIDDSVSIEFIYPNYHKITCGQMVFWNNNSIKSLIIPDNLKILSEWMFAFCSNLEYVEIPNSVSKINEYCFCACRNIKEIKFGSDSNTFFSVYPSYKEELPYECRIKTSDCPEGKTVTEWINEKNNQKN